MRAVSDRQPPAGRDARVTQPGDDQYNPPPSSLLLPVSCFLLPVATLDKNSNHTNQSQFVVRLESLLYYILGHFANLTNKTLFLCPPSISPGCGTLRCVFKKQNDKITKRTSDFIFHGAVFFLFFMYTISFERLKT